MEKDELLALVDKFEEFMIKKDLDTGEQYDVAMLLMERAKNTKLDFYESVDEELDELEEEPEPELEDEPADEEELADAPTFEEEEFEKELAAEVAEEIKPSPTRTTNTTSKRPIPSTKPLPATKQLIRKPRITLKRTR